MYLGLGRVEDDQSLDFPSCQLHKLECLGNTIMPRKTTIRKIQCKLDADGKHTKIGEEYEVTQQRQGSGTNCFSMRTRLAGAPEED